MAGVGGYQKPTNPAMASGPGAMSQRTDGGPGQPARYVSGMPYGQGQEFMDLQSSAPMAAMPTAQTPSMSATVGAAGAGPIVPLAAPSQRPDEPVTSGADAGMGPGSEVLALDEPSLEDEAAREALLTYMPALLFIAAQPNTAPETRALIRQLRELS
jgi:hypothetical protein